MAPYWIWNFVNMKHTLITLTITSSAAIAAPTFTAAQHRAQDASVRNLTHIMRSCQCPLRQAKSTTEIT